MNEPTTNTVAAADCRQHPESQQPQACPSLRYLICQITATLLLAVAVAVAAWLLLRPTMQPPAAAGATAAPWVGTDTTEQALHRVKQWTFADALPHLTQPAHCAGPA